MFNVGADRLAQLKLGEKYFSADNEHIQEVALGHMRAVYGFDETNVGKVETNLTVKNLKSNIRIFQAKPIMVLNLFKQRLVISKQAGPTQYYGE